MSYREGRFWQPDVTVATVVVRDGRLLCVEEQVNGSCVLNQPAGHLEPDEGLVEAALRETLEETGWDVRLTALDRKSTRLNSSHVKISYAVFCLKKKKDK